MGLFVQDVALMLKDMQGKQHTLLQVNALLVANSFYALPSVIPGASSCTSCTSFV